jgi:membrane protease YdiL (CAAX protease family)
MSLVTASLNYLLTPSGRFEWVNTPLLSWTFPMALLASIFLDVGGVTEETGWRGFALPTLQNRMTPLAATLIVGLMWGVWHFPARPDTSQALTAFGAARCFSPSYSSGFCSSRLS